MKNVHDFDGKLKNIFIPTKKFSITEKKQSFEQLIKNLTDINAKNALRTIILSLDHPNGKNENYQPENLLDASDILIEILHLDYKPLIFLLQEQLSDTSRLGLCNSGRVTRLLQLWIALNSNKKNKHLLTNNKDLK